MAEAIPFRALRYEPGRIGGPLESVVAPPYDVISAAQQDELYGRSPHNVVRLILNRQRDGDGPSDDRYTRAAKHLRDWLAQGVLKEDAQPAFYVYEQTFTVLSGHPPQAQQFVRRGVLTALKLEPFGEGRVYAHEETFPAPKADRLQLFRACRANFSPVFGLVPDEGGLFELLRAATGSRAPDMEVREESGVLNRVWIVRHPAVCARISAALADQPVFIADGHHRYETACNYRAERRAADGAPREPRQAAYEYVLMMCVPMSDPGLVILPTHRLLRAPQGFAAEAFLKRAEQCFTVKPADQAAVAALADARGGPVRLGLVGDGGRNWVWSAKPELAGAMKRAVPDRSSAWRELDTAVLHELVLKQWLWEGRPPTGDHGGVTYTKDVGEVFSEVRAGTHDQGFVLRPTGLEQVRAVAQAGERMPQKTTYFSPKLLSGLVMRML